MPKFVDNPLCSCTETDTCASCRFCGTHNTTQGRKTLCEKITRFLVLQPIYQHALAQAMQALFPDKIVYDDEKDICTILFEAVLFEADSADTTPFSYFIRHAPLSPDEKRLYEAWRTHTRYEFFAVEKVECSSDPGVKPPAAVPRMVELPTGTSGTSAGTRHRVRC